MYGEVRTGRVGVTAGSLQWKDVVFLLRSAWLVSYLLWKGRGSAVGGGGKSTSTLLVC